MGNNDLLAREAKEFIANSPLNKVEELGGMQIYGEPLVCFADARDLLFSRLKEPEVVGPAHLLPEEWLKEAQTVVSYFLPFSKEVRLANRIEGLPATEWVYGRIEGETCNIGLREHLLGKIETMGGKSVAPALDSQYAVVDQRSNWSERHVAFIAGLGTFGLSKSLLTEKGSAGRCGSVVTDLKLEVSQRPYQDIYQYCNMCGDCIGRCPSGAIKEEGKHIPTCSAYVSKVVKPIFAPRYGCGKCQTAVACEFSLP